MTLSGNLGFVPIDEVLRLLTRSHRQGAIEVTGDRVRGRVFFGESGIDLATTYDDQDLHRHLLNSNYVTEDALDRIKSEGTTLAAVADNPAIVDLVRELSVEGLYQMASRGESFEVQEASTTPYASPAAFDLDKLLKDVSQRDADWRKVAESIPDLGATVEFRRDLGDRDDVTVNGDEWKLLSEIGAGSSVRELADRLGTTEFWAAKVAARLLGADLVRVGGTDPAVGKSIRPTVEVTDEVETQPQPTEPEVAFAPPVAETRDTQVEDAAEQVLRVPDQDDDDVDPDESWWQEPSAEDAEKAEESDEDDLESRTPAVVSEGLSEIPAVESADDDEVEEDTEAFLEKVFSELDSSEDDSEGGHGLLRRRRMGTLRDFSSDS